MLKKVFFFHVLPIFIALLLVWGLTFLILFGLNSKRYSFWKRKNVGISETMLIKGDGNQGKIKGKHANLEEGNKAEIDYLASIKSPNQLTIFGSSEFSKSPYCSYNFLPDSIGIPAMGIGHAYHQNFSILCELLAAHDYVEKSDVCIILSLGWFDTKGTNTSAFLEFVTPNFLTSIDQNKDIDESYRKYIGKFIQEHSHEIDELSNDMEVLRASYLLDEGNVFNKYKSKIAIHLNRGFSSKNIRYQFNVNSESRIAPPLKDYFSSNKDLQDTFIRNVTNNDLFVYNEYYSNYLIEEDGSEKKGGTSDISIVDNQELEDFKTLVKYLKEMNANCSFIIQPLNPYFYSNLENYDELVVELTETLNKNDIPYLNMHVSSKADYEPGVLRDVMHLGDYGWMEINKFLVDTYYEK